MGELTAIDILIHPDDTLITHAKAANARMLASDPQGFALDENHMPHITTLQRYVRTADLDQVYAAVQRTKESVDLRKLEFTAERFAHMDMGSDIGLTAIVVTPSHQVLDFQASLIGAVEQFTESSGTADAYVRTQAEPDINDTTINYIRDYVPKHSGANFMAHVTTGLAKLGDLSRIEAEPFDTFTFAASGMGVYQLGNNGTAAKPLKNWSD